MPNAMKRYLILMVIAESLVAAIATGIMHLVNLDQAIFTLVIGVFATAVVLQVALTIAMYRLKRAL